MAVKKNSKVPITSDETFTSLQISKDIENMEQGLKLLYDLQQTDTKIDNIYILRGELPIEVQDLENEIAASEEKIATLTREIKEGEEFVSLRKQDISNGKALIKKYEQQRNHVKNNREFDSLSKEIEYQELSVQLADKKATDGTKRVVAKKEELELVSEELKGFKEDLKIKKKELDTIASETEKEEHELRSVSEKIQAQMHPRMLSAYKKVRENAHNGLAVVTVRRGACGGCFSDIPPQRRIEVEESKKIIVCEYCGRILVSSRFDENAEGHEAEPETTPKKRRTTKSTAKR